MYRDLEIIQTKKHLRVMKMNSKLVLSLFAFAAMAMAAGKTYTVKLYEPAMLGTTELKPGEYRVEVTDQKAVLKSGKVQKEADVKVETADSKFDTTTVRLSSGTKPQIQEIRLGGTRTKLVFSDAAKSPGI
jgi:hypothetical protein